MNKFCGNCGSQLVNGVCVYCQNNNVNPQQSIDQVAQPTLMGTESLNLDGNKPAIDPVINKSASNKGIIGIILGIVAFFVFGYLSFIGLSLSITGLNEAKNNGGGSGKTLSIIGIVVCSVDVAFIILGIIMKIVG